jgi:glycosyltransferase involved in cell wall biosynthesis
MISVIIPTIFICDLKNFLFTLKELESSQHVKEIIVINNSCDTSKLEVFKSFKKVSVINTQKNIYVNPAWNLGMSKASGKYFLIMNDDVILVKNTIQKCIDALNADPNIGILTVKTAVNKDLNSYLFEEKETQKKPPKLTSKIDNNGRHGWFMMGEAKHWKDVPDQFKLFYGDDLIYKGFSELGKKNMMVEEGTLISHFQSTSIMNEAFQKEKKPIADQDHLNWNKLRGLVSK